MTCVFNKHFFLGYILIMADLDDQLLEGGIDLSSEDHNLQMNQENSISFDLIENGQSNNADSQTSADSVSLLSIILIK